MELKMQVLAYYQNLFSYSLTCPPSPECVLVLGQEFPTATCQLNTNPSLAGVTSHGTGGLPHHSTALAVCPNFSQNQDSTGGFRGASAGRGCVGRVLPLSHHISPTPGVPGGVGGAVGGNSQTFLSIVPEIPCNLTPVLCEQFIT